MPEEKKAAETNAKAAKDAKPGKLSKILHWFATLPQRIAKPFRNMFYELKKVTWPSKEKLISYSCIVLAFMLLMGVVIGLLDMGASAGVRLLIPQTSSASTVTADTTADVAEETADTAADAAEAAATAAADAEAAAADAAAAVEEAAGETTENTEKSDSGEN